MAIITKIESQKKSKDRVNIYVDDTYFMSVFTELVYTFNLRKGMIFDSDELKPLLEKEMYLSAKNKALNILARADQSEKNMREKLSGDFEENTIDAVLDFLKKNKFVDDEMLAQKIINTNINLNKVGKNKIKQNLYNKGISSDLISETISELDNDTEYENALYLAQKRLKRIKDTDIRKVQQKLYQHLAYKGFNYDIINRVTKVLVNSDESIF